MQGITGMRIGRVLARSKNDYDKKTQKFNVHNTLTHDKDNNVILGEHTKTYNKKKEVDEGQRYLPLNNSLLAGAVEIIEEQCNKKITNIYGLLFWDYDKNTFITHGEVNAWLKRINKKYNISHEEISSHRLRHTALTNWQEKGVPLDVIQYLAGYVRGSSITKEVYIDITEEYIHNELRKFC